MSHRFVYHRRPPVAFDRLPLSVYCARNICPCARSSPFPFYLTTETKIQSEREYARRASAFRRCSNFRPCLCFHSTLTKSTRKAPGPRARRQLRNVRSEKTGLKDSKRTGRAIDGSRSGKTVREANGKRVRFPCRRLPSTLSCAARTHRPRLVRKAKL